MIYELKQFKEKLIQKYDTSIDNNMDPLVLRMCNTETMKWLYASGNIKLFRKLKICNKLNDEIVVRNTGNELFIGLKLCGDLVDITKLVTSPNKYGSALFKRFFKNYDEVLINHIMDYAVLLTTMNYDWLIECRDNGYARTYTNKHNTTIIIKDHAMIYGNGAHAGANVPDVELKEFCQYLYIEDRTKPTNTNSFIAVTNWS